MGDFEFLDLGQETIRIGGIRGIVYLPFVGVM